MKAAPPPVELPPGLACRLAAAAALSDVVMNGRGLDEALASAAAHPRFVTGLEDRDRALARSIVVVSLRRLGTLRRFLGRLLDKGLPKKSGQLEWILIVTAAQILFLDVPDHAAVNACVQAVRLDPASAGFAALANAVARNVARQRDEHESDDPFADTPTWLAARWRKTYGDETAAAIAAANRAEVPLDLSVKSDPRAGPSGWRATCSPQARCGCAAACPCRRCRATPRASGGCRTPPLPCRRACSGPSRASAWPTSAPRRAARPRSSA